MVRGYNDRAEHALGIVQNTKFEGLTLSDFQLTNYTRVKLSVIHVLRRGALAAVPK